MNIFVPYRSPLASARVLDRRRLNKQVIECGQILKAIEGTSGAWRNHPVVKMYAPFTLWVRVYREILASYRNGVELITLDALSKEITPYFLTDDFCENMRRRLFTKDPEYYAPYFGTLDCSYDNWYIIDHELLIYRKGKRLK